MNGYRIGFALIALSLLGLGVAHLRTRDLAPAAAEINYGQVPDFSLTESGGRTVTQQDFSGSIWIADFIFTSCAGTCPAMSGEMQTLQNSLPREVRLASFTVDPTRDTTEVLQDYAKRFGADPDRWLFMTGSRQALYDLSIKGFKLALDDLQGSDAEPITHSSRFVLIDKTGRIRGYYGSTEAEELKRLVSDAKGLL